MSETPRLEDVPAVEAIARLGPWFEELVLGNAHGSAWPTSAKDAQEIAAWRGSFAQVRQELENYFSTLIAAVDSLDTELERIANGERA